MVNLGNRNILPWVNVEWRGCALRPCKCCRDLSTFLSDREQVLGSLDPKVRQERENSGVWECGVP